MAVLHVAELEVGRLMQASPGPEIPRGSLPSFAQLFSEGMSVPAVALATLGDVLWLVAYALILIKGMGPVVASGKAMERAGVAAKDLEVVELNEAFASQALACIDELGLEMEKINIDGGALALGHPLGATGARITGKAAQVMHREGKGLALASQCIGGGQGIATVLEAA